MISPSGSRSGSRSNKHIFDQPITPSSPSNLNFVHFFHNFWLFKRQMAQIQVNILIVQWLKWFFNYLVTSTLKLNVTLTLKLNVTSFTDVDCLVHVLFFNLFVYGQSNPDACCWGLHKTDSEKTWYTVAKRCFWMCLHNNLVQ